MDEKMKNINLNEELWDEYRKEILEKNTPYTIGTFGIWCYHKGLTQCLINSSNAHSGKSEEKRC